MTIHLPRIGVTPCQRAIALIEEYPKNIVGSFWIMCGYGFEHENIPSWWIDNVLEDNQAQGIIDALNQGLLDGEYSNPLYLGFCIIVVATPSNPGDLSYVIQHIRMCHFEGISLLELMSEHNIPAHTEVTYPELFLQHRYAGDSDTYKYLRSNLTHWSTQVWEDYCSYLMAEHGQSMFSDYLRQINAIRGAVRATVESSKKPLILTEGETDEIYIKTALELLQEKKILEQIEIKWVGAPTGKGKNINAGDTGLTNTQKVLIANPEFINNQKVMLLYDSDTKKPDEDHENLIIRKIPKRENAKIRKGIENLFPDHLFSSDFYTADTKISDYGEEHKIQKFQKMKFCRWVCEERKQVSDFENFKPVVNIIKNFLSEINSN